MKLTRIDKFRDTRPDAIISDRVTDKDDELLLALSECLKCEEVEVFERDGWTYIWGV